MPAAIGRVTNSVLRKINSLIINFMFQKSLNLLSSIPSFAGFKEWCECKDKLLFAMFGLGSTLHRRCVQYGRSHSEYACPRNEKPCATDASHWDEAVDVWFIIQHHNFQHGLSYISLFVESVIVEASLWLLNNLCQGKFHKDIFLGFVTWFEMSIKRKQHSWGCLNH